ncbi:MAG: TolC family protein [Candidatus Pseudobacter hemicellulosilyticus]|uniref:TolC family protein n=1 Tax=Candidatus Pseudobacter hemicellulosilyticus TaxID=3121375 RepID=A0AAJ5WQU6_9BACT|nr:MAG: TolC family protein [Pseudobacter sp.]
MQHLTKWLNKLVKWRLVLALFVASPALAQEPSSLSLEQAWQLAQQHYPMICQKDLVRRTADLSISNISKGYLPQLAIAGQATYQSEVTSVPVKIPGINIDEPAKDQYKLTAEVSQLLYDGGNSAAQKNVQRVSALVSDQQAEVELYKIKDRINQLYLGILLIDEQLKQTALIKADLELGVRRVTAQVQHGTVLRSNQLVLEAELLKTDQRSIELAANRRGLLEVLGLFINRSLEDSVQLSLPTAVAAIPEAINRPELQLFRYQDSLYQVQEQLVNAKNRPRTSVFFQGGYGRPGLNMLSNQFDWYYLTGLRLNWSLGGLYTAKKEKQLLDVNQRMVAVQKDVFLLNTESQLRQQRSDWDKLEQLIRTDEQIIDLRTRVKQAANAQLENGVITANDYLREVNAEDQARLLLITHKLQLLQAQLNYQSISGNQ